MSDKITIIRATKNADNPYVILRKNVAQDRSLSWEARGMLTYILSHPDDWKVIPKDLQQKCGGAKVYSILNELIDAGYIERRVVRDEKKRFTTWQYLVYETPQPIKSDIETEPLLTFPQMAQPQMENRDALLSTEESLSTESLKETLAPQENGAVSPEWSGDTPNGEPIQRTWGKSELDDTPINTQSTVDSSSTVQYDKPATPGDITDKQWLQARPVHMLGEALGIPATNGDWSGYKGVTNQLRDSGITLDEYGDYVEWVKGLAKKCTPPWDVTLHSLTTPGRMSKFVAAGKPRASKQPAAFTVGMTLING